MSFKRLWLALAMVIGLGAPAIGAPLSAYATLPSVEAVAVSPAGAQVAYVVSNGRDRVIVIQGTASGKATLNAPTGSAKVRDVAWAGESHLLIVTSATASPIDVMGSRREWFMLFSLNLGTRRVTPLMRDTDRAMNTIFGLPVVRTVNGRPTVFVQGEKFADNGQGRLSAFKIDLQHGISTMLEMGEYDTRDWIVGADGTLVAQEAYDPRSGHWALKLRDGGGWKEVASAVALQDRPYVLGLGRAPDSVLYAGPDEQGRWAWREASLVAGKAGEPIPMVDDQGSVRDPRDGRLIGLHAVVGDEARYTFFDPMDAKVWAAVQRAFPGSALRLESWSDDRRKIVVRADSPDEGPAFALVDLATRHATWLGAEYEGVKPEDIAAKQALRFKARDGLPLTGYLTYPKGREPKAMPVIVLPHGGPAARDLPGFDWWAQAMASRGYAVLQVNFRGSDGLGHDLLRAGYGQWGRKMQTDLDDGLQEVAQRGLVDPKRACIVGGSYGGYAALAAVTLDPGHYRCAVSVAGVSDLRRQVVYSRGLGGISTERYWTRFMGAQDLGDPVLAKYSPAANADKADAPVLLIHGRDDTVVPLEQSHIMADALKKAGKPVELVIEPGEDHWLSRGETRLQMLTATMAFVEKHNPPN